MELDDEWLSFLGNPHQTNAVKQTESGPIPVPTELYISTNTIISYLNEPIELASTFWKIPILPYNCPMEGVIKKQMKFNSTTPEEVSAIQAQLKDSEYAIEHIISHVEDKGTLRYKDVRKITRGISKRDILSYRIRHKGAFYNCFALVIRLKLDTFKEFHVKVFNTGKIEIPGVQQVEHIPLIIQYLLSIMRPYYPEIVYHSFMEETVLINSNFNCGFYIKRNELFHLLKYKYNISAVYDPCSYPGIQCKVYYNKGVMTTIQTTAVSFMVFRTGSILIVGKCSIEVIHEIYRYLIQLLETEYSEIVETHTLPIKKEMLPRKNKRFILMS
jgi:TATA-box binding protein (TBP) (component of TFIID and TFIIIB)